MRNLTWPSIAKLTQPWRLSIEGHTRGSPNAEGVGVFSRGSGARWVGEISVAPMTLDNGLSFRAFLHRLRGRSGSFLLPVPGSERESLGSTTVYTDDTRFTDHTAYTDYAVTYKARARVSGSTLAGSDSITLRLIEDSAYLTAGRFMAIGNVSTTGQLVRIVSVSGSTVTFRPRLRNAVSSNTIVEYGYVSGLFRLMDNQVLLPMRKDLCYGATIPIEEFR